MPRGARLFTTLATILFDGIAYGMLLFVLAVGLAVTLGLMNFVNLAHGAFAMAGGYVTVLLVNKAGVPFLLCLPIAFLVSAALGLAMEFALYRRLYGRPHLDQVMFTVGLAFMAVGGTTWLLGPSQVFVQLPNYLQGRFDFLGVAIGRYRLLIVILCGVLTILLQVLLSRTRFGARLRAAVDNQAVARGIGIPVGLVFAATFALGSGLAGLGGALGAEILGLDPQFPLKFMIYFLIVVTVGGGSSIVGPFLASLLLGIGDVAGKYFVPQYGAFAIYTIMLVVLVLRPQGLFARGARG